jgi:succinyl-CoA synthetase beta subunit
MDFLMVFGSAHRALKAEEVLKEAGLPFRLLPAPKALEPHCDLVIRVNGQTLAEAREVLENMGVKPRTIYRREREDYVEV